jgi:hypothetical protein
MKFYNIVTSSKQFEINEIIMNMSNTEVDCIQSLYNSISIVEYTNELGNECMFSILDDYYLNKLSEFLKKYSLNFKVFDLTNDVIFDYNFKTNFKNEFGRAIEDDILNLIKKFKKNFISKDDILDKILERGIDSLTDFDLDILNS